MKLTLIIPALTAGGAERVMSILANYWSSKGWDITLLTLDDGSKPPFFKLNPNICHKPLNLQKDSANALTAVFNNLRRLIVLRKAIAGEQPDAVISFLDTTNVLTILASWRSGLKVIISERIDTGSQPISPIWNFLRKWAYPKASALVVLTERAKNNLEVKGSLPCYVIPNPVLVSPTVGKKPTELPYGKRVVAMGRLTEQKGFDILLEAFARARTSFPDWSLFIIGEGPLRQSLEARSQQPDLQGSVTFTGRLDTPSSILEISQLFVLSSRYEGFPNALTEAMAMGLPVISTDCPTGPREIIQNGINGLLVPPQDPNALATAMQRLMADPSERARLGHEAEQIIERYSLERIIGQWEVLLTELQTE